ncbi:hypothetical protein [Actinomadura sp. K4S16]|uniref:hypothetical protein n=1 Tax=Actinomadura sp. K4S16 TaxID=1316147 RepID=UPI0011EEE018|nr:hypothetical protein [Actinomadura sp. K4S16]
MPEPARWLRTAEIPLADLTPFPGNARRGDVRMILASLQQNAQYRSLVVRDTGDGTLTVLTGNQTYEALQRHGPDTCVRGTADAPGCALCSEGNWLETARCEVITCDDETAKRINVGDNRIHDLGGYDDKALASLLEDLPDLGGTGYSSEDLDGLLRVTGTLGQQAADFLTPFRDQTIPAPGQPAPAGTAPPSGLAPLQPRAGVSQTMQPPPQAPYAPPEQITAPHSSATADSLVPVQWTVTVEERDRIRSTLRAAAERFGAPDASTALVMIIDSYAATLATAPEETP